MSTAQSIMASAGYQKLLKAVVHDEEKSPNFHNYRGKLAWVVERANHYAEKTGLKAEDILDSWEQHRSYWYMNYYQDCKQPLITSEHVRVFETKDDLLTAIGNKGFRCPNCAKASHSPYQCDSGAMVGDKVCDWKVYGLFRDLGKGITVFVKEEVFGELIFMPISWEEKK